MAKAYYNEIDRKMAAWLRELVWFGYIADGDVDERSVEDVTPGDLSGYTQCHFFAGIGGWSYALRLAGWPDTRSVWTGSCPCQPFSTAGEGRGFADERHLWPAWYWLIAKCRPSVIFGEQVASYLGWLDLVQTDLEGAEYACGRAIIGAHSVGAPHIRQRLYWMADNGGERRRQVSANVRGSSERSAAQKLDQRSAYGCAVHYSALADSSSSARLEVICEQQTRSQQPTTERSGATGPVLSQSAGNSPLGHASCSGSGGHASGSGSRGHAGSVSGEESGVERQVWSEPHQSELTSVWSTVEWVSCRDGKTRPVEPGSFPLANGVPSRVDLLRGYGNAIVPQNAAAFIEAYLG